MTMEDPPCTSIDDFPLKPPIYKGIPSKTPAANFQPIGSHLVRSPIAQLSLESKSRNMGRLQYGNEGLQIPMDVSEHVFFCVLFSMVFVDFLDQRILPSFLRQHLAARQGPNSNPDNGPDQRKMHANPLMLPGVPQKKNARSNPGWWYTYPFW